jgi:heterogeneous nuclear ribonucleoprotein A1/A3
MVNMQNKIFVGNLPFKIDDQELQDVFGKFGAISEIKIPTDRESGRTRGFAFITFETQQAAQEALAMDGQKLGDRVMRVNMATEKKEGSGSRGGRGNNKGRGDRGR